MLIIAVLFILQCYLLSINCNSHDNDMIVYVENQDSWYFIDDDNYYLVNDKIIRYFLTTGYRNGVLDINSRTKNYIYNNITISDVRELDITYNKGANYPSFDLTASDKQIETNLNILYNMFNYNQPSNFFDIKIIARKLNYCKNGAIVAIDKNKYLGTSLADFFWLNKDLDIDNSNNNQEIIFPHTTIFEDDRRFLLLPNGDIFTIFTAIVSEKPTGNKCGIRYLNKINDNGKITYKFTDQTILYKDDIMTNLDKAFEKNWSPFNYKGSIMLIQSFSPFTVYKLSHPNKKNTLTLHSKVADIDYTAQSVDLVSTVSCPSYHSAFGTIRGGTPAMLVRGQYLAFSHTMDRDKSSILKVLLPDFHFYYFIYAYTFTNKIPFRITKTSRFPLADPLFKPSVLHNEPVLIIFAVTYVLLDKNDNVIFEGQEEPDPDTTTVLLTVGVEDKKTYTMKIRLNDVLDGMKDIVC